MKSGLRTLTLAGCVAAASGMTVTIGSISYEPATDITASLAVSEAACALKSSLADGDFEASEKLYAGTVLETSAKTDDGNDYTAEYAKYFGGVDWIDTQLHQAFHGDGDFASMDAATVDAARTEAVEKTAVDAIAVKETMKHLFASLDETSAESITEWDHAFASFFGKDLKCAVYARAQKRAGNYDTYATGDAEIAAANEVALNAFIDGAAALTAEDMDAFQAAAEKVMGAIATVYSQAALRYLYLLDMDVVEGTSTADHQGEGMAFWNVIAPMYAETGLSMDLHDNIKDVYYNLKVAPVAPNMRYCEGKEYFSTVGPKLNLVEGGVTAEMMGTFEHDDKWKCPEGEPVTAPTAAAAEASSDDGEATSTSAGSDDSSAKTASLSIFGAMSALLAFIL